jgi:hypothetical protein
MIKLAAELAEDEDDDEDEVLALAGTDTPEHAFSKRRVQNTATEAAPWKAMIRVLRSRCPAAVER